MPRYGEAPKSYTWEQETNKFATPPVRTSTATVAEETKDPIERERLRKRKGLTEALRKRLQEKGLTMPDSEVQRWLDAAERREGDRMMAEAQDREQQQERTQRQIRHRGTLDRAMRAQASGEMSVVPMNMTADEFPGTKPQANIPLP